MIHSLFTNARVKLTLWYVLVIAVVCAAFSGALYTINAREISRVIQNQRFILERKLQEGGVVLAPRQLHALLQLADPEIEKEARMRFLRWLIGVDILIILGSAGLAYWWAGKALEPIDTMMQKQKRFVSDASHELKTPVTALRTSLEVTLRDPKMSLKDAKKTLQGILEDVTQLQTLSNKLLKLSTYQEFHDVEMQAVSLPSLSNQAIRSLLPLAEKKNITVKKSYIADSVSDVKGNPTQLSEVLLILLDNAIKYTPAKGSITVVLQQHGRFVTCAVQDTGPGIPLEDQPYIFDRFYRSDKVRSTQTNSVGLGLAIASEIITAHKGKIFVKSKPGSGAIFTFQLPKY